jgi:hemolysin-activating ACP:hemolysin acyltransferase
MNPKVSVGTVIWKRKIPAPAGDQTPVIHSADTQLYHSDTIAKIISKAKLSLRTVNI